MAFQDPIFHMDKKTGESSTEVAHGITSKCSEQTNAQRVLDDNPGHWSIENSCRYVIDWYCDEDRSRKRTGYGPENITRLRRFVVAIIKSKRVSSVAQKMQQLTRNVRVVFDHLRMTDNSCAQCAIHRCW